jgi:hypothetical protein
MTDVNLNLTERESKLLADVIKDGHEVTGIEKNPAEFRVQFTYQGGKAVGSRAIVYSIAAAFIRTKNEIKKLERELGYR